MTPETGGHGHKSGGGMWEAPVMKYNPDVGNFSWGEGVPDYYQDHVNAAGAMDPNVQRARGLGYGSRSSFRGFLNDLQGRPLQSEALGRGMIQQGQQAIANNSASQLASLPGRYNPAAARQAQLSSASAGQNMALQAQQQTLASAIQEQAARDSILGQGWSNLSGQDISRMGAESDNWGKQQGAQQGWAGMGLQDKTTQAAQKADYEKTKMAGYMGKDIPGTNWGAAALQGVASAIPLLMTSDVRAKENIQPARGEARELLEVLAAEGPMQYDYRQEYGGQHSYGPMAQTMEQAGPIGEAMVGKDPDGTRHLRLPEMVKGMASAMAEQQRQIEELKGGGLASAAAKPVARPGEIEMNIDGHTVFLPSQEMAAQYVRQRLGGEPEWASAGSDYQGLPQGQEQQAAELTSRPITEEEKRRWRF